MNSREVEERLRYMLKQCDAFSHCKYYARQDCCNGCCEAVRIAAKRLGREEQQRWIPIEERVPEDDRYILLSFANFSLPAVGRYEKETFYEGDCEAPCSKYGFRVNAWMELPESYKGEAQE